MTTEIIRNEEIAISNTKLRKFTEDIFKQGLNIKKSLARVAVILVKIDESKCYEQDGFESVQDYAARVLGWKQASTYAMLRVGRDYLDGKTYESVLPHGDTDYSTSQLQALLPLKSVEKAKELAEENIINPDMTVKAIKDVVKNYTGKNVNVETQEDDTEEKENGVIETPAYEVVVRVEVIRKSDGTTAILLNDSEVVFETAIDAIYKSI